MSRRAIILAVAVAAVLAYLLLDFFITTDRERVAHLIERVIDAVERGDAKAALAPVPRNYRSGRMDRAGLVALAAAFFDQYGVKRVHVLGRDIALSGRLAVVDLAVLVRAARRDGWVTTGRSRWHVRLRRVQGPAGPEWVVTDVSPTELYGQPVGDWTLIVQQLELMRETRAGHPAAPEP